MTTYGHSWRYVPYVEVSILFDLYSSTDWLTGDARNITIEIMATVARVIESDGLNNHDISCSIHTCHCASFDNEENEAVD